MQRSSTYKILICNLVVTANFASAQTTPPPSMGERPKNQEIVIEQRGDKVSYSLTREGQIQTHEVDGAELLDVIVEFSDTPLFILQKYGSRAVSKSSSFQAQFARFSADLSLIYTNLTTTAKRRTLPRPEIRRTYYKIFSGVSVRIPRLALAQIARLDYVKKIHLDHKVELHLEESVPLIGAVKVWEQLGSRGEGIVIGIIDTGIDYMHPALGGGFRPGFKVIGGYDFANDDPDPMDDNNHGTHVAGIVAADGEA